MEGGWDTPVLGTLTWRVCLDDTAAHDTLP